MKVRLDYITNSSSSSYTCVVCNETYSGWDANLRDAEMYNCVNGHTFCKYHADINENNIKNILIELMKNRINFYEDQINKYPNDKDYLKWIDEEKQILKQVIDDDEDIDIDDLLDEYEFRHNVPELYCPVCSFGSLNDTIMAKYLLKKYNINLNELAKELKEKFNSFDEFETYCK